MSLKIKDLKIQIEYYLKLTLPDIRAKIERKPDLIVWEEVNFDDVTIRFITQNKSKNSLWARVAQAGNEVIQIVQTRWGKNKIWKYHGAVINGEIYWYDEGNAWKERNIYDKYILDEVIKK